MTSAVVAAPIPSLPPTTKPRTRTKARKRRMRICTGTSIQHCPIRLNKKGKGSTVDVNKQKQISTRIVCEK